MYTLPNKVEDWTETDCNTLLSQLQTFYRKYNVNDYYIIGSRCNGIDRPLDIDVSLDVHDDIITWRNLDLNNNFVELTRRAISERRLKENFRERFNVIIEKETSQLLYNTIEGFPMPYFNLKTRTLYNKTPYEKFPYKIITYDYDNHIFYMKLRPEGLTPEEKIYYTNKIYEKLNIEIRQTITLTNEMKQWMEKFPWKIISFLSILSKYHYNLDLESKNWVKKQSESLKSVPYDKMRKYIKEAVSRPDADLFIILFHKCEIYENLSVF